MRAIGLALAGLSLLALAACGSPALRPRGSRDANVLASTGRREPEPTPPEGTTSLAPTGTLCTSEIPFADMIASTLEP